MPAAPATVPPQEFLQLIGHRVRWQLLQELGTSDRRVNELSRLLDAPQNLVSYHLGKLRDAEMVAARQSSADGRDNYYAIDLVRLGESLGATTAALHPGLRPVEQRQTATRHADPSRLPQAATRVLFLCTGNSARSQMAEALTRSRSEGAVESYSAGSQPKPIHPNATRVMLHDYGIDLSGHRSKQLNVFAEQRFDRVVTLCDKVREVCPEFPGHPDHIHWSVPDPGASGEPEHHDASYAEFRRVARELDTRIGFFLARIAAQIPPTPPTGTNSSTNNTVEEP